MADASTPSCSARTTTTPTRPGNDAARPGRVARRARPRRRLRRHRRLAHVPRRDGARLPAAPAPRLRDRHVRAPRADRPLRLARRGGALRPRRHAVAHRRPRHRALRDVPAARPRRARTRSSCSRSGSTCPPPTSSSTRTSRCCGTTTLPRRRGAPTPTAASTESPSIAGALDGHAPPRAAAQLVGGATRRRRRDLAPRVSSRDATWSLPCGAAPRDRAHRALRVRGRRSRVGDTTVERADRRRRARRRRGTGRRPAPTAPRCSCSRASDRRAGRAVRPVRDERASRDPAGVRGLPAHRLRRLAVADDDPVHGADAGASPATPTVTRTRRVRPNRSAEQFQATVLDHSGAAHVASNAEMSGSTSYTSTVSLRRAGSVMRTAPRCGARATDRRPRPSHHGLAAHRHRAESVGEQVVEPGTPRRSPDRSGAPTSRSRLRRSGGAGRGPRVWVRRPRPARSRRRRETCGRASRARRRRGGRSRRRRSSTTARPTNRSLASNCSMCSTTRVPAWVLRIAYGSDQVLSVSPGTSGRCRRMSCSPCTPLRPDSKTSRVRPHWRRTARRTPGSPGTWAAPRRRASARGSVSLVAAAYRRSIRGRARRGTARGVGRDQRRRRPRRAAYGATVVSELVRVGIHLPQFGRAASPAAIANAARPPRRWGSPTCG